MVEYKTKLKNNNQFLILICISWIIVQLSFLGGITYFLLLFFQGGKIVYILISLILFIIFLYLFRFPKNYIQEDLAITNNDLIIEKPSEIFFWKKVQVKSNFADITDVKMTGDGDLIIKFSSGIDRDFDLKYKCKDNIKQIMKIHKLIKKRIR